MANHQLPLLVEPDALAERLHDPNLLIVDLSNPERFEHSHIPGSVNLPYSQLLRAEPPAKGLFPEPEQLSRALSAIGLTDDVHVVACDDEGSGRAGRLLWTLEALGHDGLSLLNGGLTAWRAENYPLESGVVDPRPSDYQARVRNPDVLADKQFILDHLDDDNVIVFDARSPGEYSGEDVRAARGGHIPGAINLEWTQCMDRGNNLRFQPVETLRAMLKTRGVTPDKEIITHCQTHHRSAHTFMVLRYLGYPNVRGYAGSWSEWGNDPETPVRTGDEP